MSPVAPDTLHADVARAARGDREAFARLVAATSGLVTSVALVEARDLETSRDAAQEAFLHVWRDLPSLRNPASFLPWLREVTRRRAREARERSRRLVTGAPAEEALAAAADAAPGATERLLGAEEHRALAAALDALPDEAREVVVLYYREGRSAAQVAHLLGLSEEAVWQRLSRARSRLREDLLARAGDLFAATAPGAAFTTAVLAALGAAAPTAAGAATAAGAGAGAGAKWAAGGAAGLAGGIVAAAGLVGSLAMGSETRWFLAGAADEAERAALRRYGRASQACIWLFAVALPVTAFLLRVRWLYAASFGLYALGLVAVQRLLLPPAAVARLEEKRGGRLALLGGQALGVGGGLLCLGLAWWLRGHPEAGALWRR